MLEGNFGPLFWAHSNGLLYYRRGVLVIPMRLVR